MAPAKPIVVAKPITPVVKKPEPVLKKKVERDMDMDEDNREQDSLVVEYKVPSIRRPMGPIPKPHINTDK